MQRNQSGRYCTKCGERILIQLALPFDNMDSSEVFVNYSDGTLHKCRNAKYVERHISETNKAKDHKEVNL